MVEKIVKSDKEWESELSHEQFLVLRKHATEQPFTGKYVNTHEDGIYRCAACGNELFSSDTKFDSGSGWPSFDAVSNSESIELKEDHSFFMKRIEVLCAKCGGHLGHLFDDGPTNTGQRYCINSAALDLKST